MTQVQKVEAVQEAMRQIRAAATQLRTNYFPTASRVEDWIRRGSLFMEVKRGAVFLFRKDRDFLHLYFSALDLAALQGEIASLTSPSGTSRMIIDLLGKEADLVELVPVLRQVSWQPYERLMRLARIGDGTIPPDRQTELAVSAAEEQEQAEIQNLIEDRFDPLSDQLPSRTEIGTAREKGQILVARQSGRLAGLLFFETAGLTSTIRYWVVGREFESLGFGSALLRFYFKIHGSVKRFILWVNEKNESAIQKYLRHGYRPDGLLDQILVKDFRPA